MICEGQRPAQRLEPPDREEAEPSPPGAPRLLAAVGQWTGKEARALRVALRMSLASFAQRITAGRTTVTDWEAAGENVVLSWAMQDALDEVLSQASDECKKRFAMRCQGGPNVWVSDSSAPDSAPDGNGGDANRKHALEIISGAGLAAAFAPLDAVERIAADIRRRGRVSAKLLDSHETVADALAELHHTERPDVLGDQVARQADVLLGLLDRPMGDTSRRRLESITVSSHAQAGLLAFNIGDRTTARRYFALARSVADDADDETLRAQALGFASVLHSSRPTGRRGNDIPRAVKLISQAADHARHADAGTRAWISRWLATDLAAVDDERGFFEAVETAQRLLEQPSHQDGRGFVALQYGVGLEQVMGNIGVGLVLLGRAEEAIDALRASLVPGWPRQAVMALTEMSAARAIQYEPEKACKGLCDALDLALNTGYLMGVERIHGVRGRFPKQWAALACVRKLDEQLRRAHATLRSVQNTCVR